MNASAFLIVLIQTTLCLTVGLIICAIARKSSGVRLLVSQIAIGASAVLLLAGSLFTLQSHPIVAVNLPEAVAFSVPSTNKEIAPIPAAQATPTPTVTSEVAKPEPQPKTEPVYQSVSSFTISKLVSMTYGAGFILSVLPMALGALWIRRVRKSCRQVTEGTTFDVVKRISERQGIRAPKLNASEAITIPFVSGLFRKQIFVPINWVDGQCDIACNAIIEHEIAHIVSRDLERKFLCRVACSLVWFQPLAWMTFRIMGNASEELCDQSVLQAGVSNTAYADTLLKIRENAKRSNVPGLVIGAVSRESNLAKRMKLILATDVSRVKKVSRLVAGIAICTLTAMAATSTFVFGQSSKTDQNQIWQGPYSGQVKLMDSTGKPVKEAKVSLIVRAKDETERLIPLTVNSDTAEISDEVVQNSVIGTLLIETAEGNVDFKRLWPAEHKIAEYRLAKPMTIRGKIGFPNSLTGPVKLNVRMLVRMIDKESMNFEFAYLEKLQRDFRSIETDRDGNFELTGMPNGAEIALGIEDKRFSFDSMLLRAKPDDQGNYTPINYKLQLASSVSGVVTRNGKPVVGMKIAAQGQKKSGWGEAVTD
ncbi:MAG: M56 family metallopeptidase, partial [Armatimonadota bacterium]